MAYNEIQKANRLKFMKYLYSRGDSIDDISYQIGLSRTTVFRWLAEDGIIVQKGRTYQRKMCEDLPKLRTMADDGSSMREMSEDFGVSTAVVDRWLKENDFQINLKARAQRQAEERKKAAKKKKRCRSCVYRGYIDGQWRCAYILKSHPPHSRGCSVMDCNKYIKGKEIKKNWGDGSW